MSDHVGLPRCQVIVAGDVVVDHHLYEGERQKPDISGARGLLHVPSTGGAEGVRQLLEAIGEEEVRLHTEEVEARAKNAKTAKPRPEPRRLLCTLGVAKPDHTPPHAAHHAFALWRPHKMTQAKDEKRLVWRTNLALGYGHDPKPDEPWAHVPKPAEDMPRGVDVLVLDDAGSLFRHGVHRACWHLPDRTGPVWILLKLSDPIAQGDLWHALVPVLADRLVVLVAAEDLRREPVRIGKGLSWERTLEDLADELNKGLKPLRQAAHLIVTFGGDAAVWIDRSTSGVAHLCFDGEAAEGEFASRHDGRAIGYMTCMAAALAYGLTQAAGAGKAGSGKSPDFEGAMESGRRGMRDLLLFGHGPAARDSPAPTGFPVDRLAKAMRGPATEQSDFSRVDIPWPPPAIADGNWMIVETSQRPLDSDGPRSLIGLAESVLRGGSAVYRRLPHVRFGDFVTAERREIEALRGIQHLMLSYKARNNVQDRPRSIGVFGPPGAGKSYAVKQIAYRLFGKEAWLEFNLSQFAGADDLIGAFHRVRDLVLTGVIPVVFWDEFDSQNYKWLRSLLAPMQDGQFQEGQVTHPIGHAVFIFAGGTAASFEAFGPRNESEKRDWELSKGPDFKSRLDAYYDVVGPNRRRTGPDKTLDPGDYGYPLRRALLIRGQLGYKDSDTLQIDPELARALLLASDYENGSRSVEKLVGPLAGAKGAPLRRSPLPPRDQIKMHMTEPDAFFRLLERDMGFTGSEEIEDLAKAIHAHWLDAAADPDRPRSSTYDMEWNNLTEAGKETNRAAARRIPSVLALVGLGVTKAAAPKAPARVVLDAHLERNIERLAEAEHDGWQDFLKRNGWRYDKVRDDKKRLHDLLVPYAALPSEAAKEKDRSQVRLYPDLAARAGFRIVWLDETA